MNLLPLTFGFHATVISIGQG